MVAVFLNNRKKRLEFTIQFGLFRSPEPHHHHHTIIIYYIIIIIIISSSYHYIYIYVLNEPRYLSFVHEWWQDRVNFASAQSDRFDALPSAAARKLYSRLDHREHVQRLSAKVAAAAGVAALEESAYQFEQQALSL